MKNHIKNTNPNSNSIRGIGKLGWTESGRLHNTLKKLVSVDDEAKVSSTKIHKTEIICSVCKKKFLTNNPNIIPNHKPGWQYNWSVSERRKVCDGSTSRLVNKDKTSISHIDKFYTIGSSYVRGETFSKGDSVVIDFSRTILKEYDTKNVGDIFKTKILDIVRYKYLRNDDSESTSYRDEVIFEDIDKAIPAHILTTVNLIKFSQE